MSRLDSRGIDRTSTPAEAESAADGAPQPTKRYDVIRCRPRIEDLYARIGRWTAVRTGEVHWQSISRRNVTTICTKDANSCIADPGDPLREA